VTADVVRVAPGFADEFPGASPSSAEVGANLVRASAAYLALLDRRRRPIEPLSQSAFQVLAILDGAGRPLPSHAISERLIVSTASTSSLLDTLEGRGLVIREPHPTDRRKTLVRITPAGTDVVDRMLPVTHQAATEAFAVLEETERETLISLLGKAMSRMRELPGTPAEQAPQRRR
jgi:DNA-binding MarR family transcriptional regulator